MIRLLKSTQNLGGFTTECKGESEKFVRGSLSADPREASPLVEPSPSLKRRKMIGGRGRSSRCPSLGGFALGAEHELVC